MHELRIHSYETSNRSHTDNQETDNQISVSKIITIFRSRLRPEHLDEYHRVAEEIEQLARTMPGFIAIKVFSAPDGERVSVVEFESQEAHDRWRIHPLHRAAQQLGRDKFYSEFFVQVCRLEREHGKPGPSPGSVTTVAPQTS